MISIVHVMKEGHVCLLKSMGDGNLNPHGVIEWLGFHVVIFSIVCFFSLRASFGMWNPMDITYFLGGTFVQ